MRRGERDAHGLHDMRGIKRSGGAGAAARCADSVLVELEENALALDKLEGDVAGVGRAVVRIAGDEAVRDLREDALLEAVSEALDLDLI